MMCIHKWLFQHQILRINIEQKPWRNFSPSVKEVHHHPQHLSISRNRTKIWKSTLWKVRSIHGKKYVRLLLKLMPWRFQETLGGLKLEVLNLEVSATEIFREKQFPWGWTEPTAIQQLVGSNNVATLKKNVSKTKNTSLSATCLPAQKVTSNLLPKIKKYRKIPWHVPGVGKCIHPLEVTVLREAGRAQESGGWVWRFGGAVKLKGKRLSQIAVEEGKISMKDWVQGSCLIHIPGQF